MLVLPTEPTYAHLSGRFHDRNLENLSADFPMGRFALLLGEIDEGLIGNGLDEAISQQIQRKAQRPDRLRLWNSLLNLIVRKSSDLMAVALVGLSAGGIWIAYHQSLAEGKEQVATDDKKPLPYGRQLIEERGIDDCSMNEIAAAAGSSVQHCPQERNETGRQTW